MSIPKRDATGRIIPPSGAPNDKAEDKKQPVSLHKLLIDDRMQKQLARAVPERVSADRMVRVTQTALRTTRDLARCSADSFFGCLFQAASLGLEPNTPLGHCYLIPRLNHRLSKELGYDNYYCTIMIGYPGMIELAYRSGYVKHINAQAVRECDYAGIEGGYFDYEYGLNEKLRFRPSEVADREDSARDGSALHPITHVWGKADLKTGGQPFVVLSHAQVERRRALSGSPDYGPWITHYEAMTQKTAIRALWKFVPKSAEMATAEVLDVALETGGRQAEVFDEKVKEALDQQGLRPLDTEGEAQQPAPAVTPAPKEEERGN